MSKVERIERDVRQLSEQWVATVRTWVSEYDVAWCELREDFRSFRLDRIVGFTPTTRTYPQQQARRLQDFFADMEARHGIAASEFDPER